MVDEPVLYGAPSSVYVRAARMALAEKGVAHRLEPVDVFADGGPPADYLARHPFGRIPAFAHGDLALYETVAILRYVDEGFQGPALQPGDPAARARMVQIQSILDSYAYRPWVWDIYVERVEGAPPDEATIAAALPKAARALDAIGAIVAEAAVWSGVEGPYFLGTEPGLADLQAAPMLALLLETPEGRALLAERPDWTAWWAAIAARSSFKETAG